MTKNDTAVTSKSLVETEVDEMIESIRQNNPADFDEDRLECLRNRMIASMQDLRDIIIHDKLGLDLPRSLAARINTHFQIAKMEWAERVHNQPDTSFDAVSDASTMKNYPTKVTTRGVPSAAETLISYVCTPDRLEAVLGDLERNFARRVAKHGEKAARRWYWWQTSRTVAAFVVQIIVSAAMIRDLLRKLGL